MDKRFEEIYTIEKVYIFNILSFLTIYCRHIFDNLFFGVGHKNVQVGSGSVINWPSGPGYVSKITVPRVQIQMKYLLIWIPYQ
jgi:hypothetical protein